MKSFSEFNSFSKGRKLHSLCHQNCYQYPLWSQTILHSGGSISKNDTNCAFKHELCIKAIQTGFHPGSPANELVKNTTSLWHLVHKTANIHDEVPMLRTGKQGDYFHIHKSVDDLPNVFNNFFSWWYFYVLKDVTSLACNISALTKDLLSVIVRNKVLTTSNL